MKDIHVLAASRGGSAVSPVSILLARGLLAGFVASIAMVMAFGIAFVAALLLARLPLGVLADWLHGLTSNALIDSARPNLYAATGIFLAGGLMWAVLYGTLAEPRLHGPPWQRGVQFALIPWVFSLAVFLPLVGGGILGWGLGAGPLPIVGNLILHVVYGATLGAVFAPASDAIPDRPSHRPDGDDVWAGPSAELGAARGLLVGLALGIVVGGLATLAPELTGAVRGLSPFGLLLATSLLGAGFGAFVGSLNGAGEGAR
jgi:hypothetical protein